jgi:hypothetical protein
LEDLGPVEVPGYPPIRLEIYLLGEETEDSEPRGIGLYAAGTMVTERFEDLAALALNHPPWTDKRLTGLVDFPGLQVAPGSRRGVVPNEAAGAFSEALLGIEPTLNEILEARERERAEKLDRSLIRDLQRAFRDFYRHRPRYSMLPTQSEKDSAGEPSEAPSGNAGAGGDEALSQPPSKSSLPESPPPQEELFPPGPLEQVTIEPSRLRVECGATRRVRAKATDAAGRALRPPDANVEYSWELWGHIGSLSDSRGEIGQTLFLASETPAEGILSVLATSSDRQASAAVPVEVTASLPTGPSDEGIPEPELVDQPGAPWRSRLLEGRWQVNSGHPDFKANSKRPALKLRYLAFLFAKEVVLRSSQDPRLESPLEQVVEVAAFADRKITDRQSRRRRSPKKSDESDR